MATPICIPLHPGGGKLGNDTEAKFTIRSIAQHFKGDFQLAIVARSLPRWAQGIELIHDGNKGLKTAINRAADRFPEGFFWWYDDCTMLRDGTVEELQVTPATKGWPSRHGTQWIKCLDDIKTKLDADRIPATDYSRPHGPYWYTKALIDESFADWPGMAGKFPFESWILSKHNWPHRYGVVKQYYGPFKSPPRSTAYFVNYNDAGNTPEMRDYLASLFPEPSAFELPSDTKRVPFTMNGTFIIQGGAQVVSVEDLQINLLK